LTYWPFWQQQKTAFPAQTLHPPHPQTGQHPEQPIADPSTLYAFFFYFFFHYNNNYYSLFASTSKFPLRRAFIICEVE
jgi:hypothetical protein